MGLSNLLANPTAAHLDLWGAVLALVALLGIIVGAGWRLHLRRQWRHHPLRLRVQGHLADAVLAVAVILAIGAVAHLAAWPVWGTPLFGTAALALLGLVIVWRQLALTTFAKNLVGYEEHYPTVAKPRAPLPQAKLPNEEIPTIAALVGALALYAIFVWHPWNHVFHMGLAPIGAIAGFALGSLIAADKGQVPPPPQAKSQTSRRKPRR